jgi:hypothetical protein|tara:strand:+ start:1490 stop:2461 length:972 start_codon:yes stop_codon:yes gene_type:complete
MKKLSLLTIIGFMFVVGCDTMNNESDVNLDDPELQALAEGLNADIGLSKSSDDAFKDALNRHGKDGKHRRDPGFLWKVAAEMQQNLTQEEKDKMFAWMDAHSVAFLHAPERKDHRGPKGDKGGMDIRLMMTVMDTDQQEALKNIMDSYRSQMDEVLRAMKDGTKDEATAKAEIEALELAMKNEIDSLLTDEQKDRIDRLQADMKQKRDDAFQLERDAMVAALEMSADQEAGLAEINQKHSDALKALFEEMKNAGDSADRKDFEGRIKDLSVTRNNELELLFSDNQLEVIKVHASLVMMFSKHCDGRKDGGWGDSGGKDDTRKD